MDIFFHKHYITTDADGRITDGFSDAFRQPSETDICINEQGGYQFRLYYFVGGIVEQRSEENPPLYDWDGMIPLYRWDGERVIPRTTEEIEADRAAIPIPEPTPAEPSVWDELDAAYTEGVNTAYDE